MTSETRKNPMLDKLQGKMVARGDQGDAPSFMDAAERMAGSVIVDVSLAQLSPNPHQPRERFDEQEIAGLAASIEKDGLIQPIVVMEDPEESGKYLIIAGERRYRAAEKAGWEKIRAIINPGGDPKRLALIENVQRVDLHPIETARALQKMKDEEGLTEEDLAVVMGKSQPVVNQLLALNRLPPKIQRDYLKCDPAQISRSSVAEVLRLRTEEQQLALWKDVKKGATRTTIRERRAEIAGGARTPRPPVDRALSSLRSAHTMLAGLTPEQLSLEPDKRTEFVGLLNALAAIVAEPQGNETANGE